MTGNKKTPVNIEINNLKKRINTKVDTVKEKIREIEDCTKELMLLGQRKDKEMKNMRVK